MKLALLLLTLFLALPTFADPVGTVKGATAAIAKAKRQHQRIKYWESWKRAKPAIEQKAYCYEGMMLGTDIDFMKNEPPMIYIENVGPMKDGKCTVTEEVIYPVWSTRNRAHVLRYAQINRTVSVDKKRHFTGVDGKVHTLRPAENIRKVKYMVTYNNKDLVSILLPEDHDQYALERVAWDAATKKLGCEPDFDKINWYGY
jgi:hypothetical protein